MSYEELTHTADVKIRACAATQDALFSEVCQALMQVMYGETGRAGYCGLSTSVHRTGNRSSVISCRKCCMSLKWTGWSSDMLTSTSTGCTSMRYLTANHLIRHGIIGERR